jgi:hypothetical protein
MRILRQGAISVQVIDRVLIAAGLPAVITQTNP